MPEGETAKKGWLVRDRSTSFAAPGGRPKVAKTGGADEQEDEEDWETDEIYAAMKALIVQLEARVRALEHEAMSTAILDRKHQLVIDCNKSYQEFVKARKEDPQTDLGSPASQAACSILFVLQSWPYKDGSARLLKMKFAIDVLVEMIRIGGPEVTATWVKEAAVFPTYDKPGQPQKSRFVFKFLGQVLVPDDEEQQKEVLAAMQQEGHPLRTISPLEIPTSQLQLKGTLFAVEAVVGETVRHSGAKLMMSKAPRGNLARKLMPKRRGA